METNDFYYKKYMKYKLKYLNLLNNYQADNLDSSESFNAAKIIDGGAFAVAPLAFKLATSKTVRDFAKKGVKLATSKNGQDFIKKNIKNVNKLTNSDQKEGKEEEKQEKEEESSETSLLSSFSKLGANEFSNMLTRLPIDQLKPMLINLIKDNKEIQKFIMKDDAIKKLICIKKNN